MLLALLLLLAPDPAPAQPDAGPAAAKQEKNDKDAAPPAGARPDETAPTLGATLFNFLPLILMGLVFYFLLIRGPMRRQEAERNALMASLKKNDRVLTHSGIYGTVVAISDKEDEITVKVDDNVRLRMTKGSILRKIEEAKQGAAKEGGA